MQVCSQPGTGLRVWHCHSCGFGGNYSSDLIPGLLHVLRSGQKKKPKQIASGVSQSIEEIKAGPNWFCPKEGREESESEPCWLAPLLHLGVS